MSNEYDELIEEYDTHWEYRKWAREYPISQRFWYVDNPFILNYIDQLESKNKEFDEILHEII